MKENRVHDESEEAALSSLLEIEPNSVSVHVRLGDIRSGIGKTELAKIHYRTALRLAEFQDLPVRTLDEVRRAAAALKRLEQDTYARREAQLAARGFPAEQWSPRFRHALEIAAGQRKYYVPEPTDLNYPGLPAIQFYDPAQFDWSVRIEASTAVIQDELNREIDRGTSEFRPYLTRHSIAPEANAALRGRKDWSVLALCENGWLAQQAVRRFPKTWAAVQAVPSPRIYGWGPTIVFSMLRAGAHIPAHTGMFNTRLVCHLPLIVPPGCRFRVGNEVREWEVGKLMIFDDTIEHEAWNDSSEDRVVLIFDIWRPELSEHERNELTALFHP